MALFVVLALVLGGYLIREMVRSTGTTPGSGAAVTPSPTAEPEPAPPPPAVEEPEPEPEPEPTDTEDVLGEVFLLPFGYLGQPGDEAAATAADQGLEPLVVDEDGQEIDSDEQAECRVTGMEPQAGFVEPGSTLVLTCREGL